MQYLQSAPPLLVKQFSPKMTGVLHDQDVSILLPILYLLVCGQSFLLDVCHVTLQMWRRRLNAPKACRTQSITSAISTRQQPQHVST